MGNSFKENLKEILEYKDMTVKELAFLTGISNRSIGNYLNSRESMPPADYACKIAKALNTTVEYLLTGKNSENPTQIFWSVNKSMALFFAINRRPLSIYITNV